MGDVVQPMLSAKVDLERLNFPIMASPKLDGIRAIVADGVVLSRRLKPIRNIYVQKVFGKKKYNGLDGELIVGLPTAEDCYNMTNSGVMSIEGEPKVMFYAFDFFTRYDWTFRDRQRALLRMLAKGAPSVTMVDQSVINTMAELLAYEERMLDAGYEGVMLRDPNSFYKFGRATTREGSLMKLKRFKDSEAEVTGLVELQHNGNPTEMDKLGHFKRSAHKAGKVAGGTLGALAVTDLLTGVTFEIGTFRGLTAAAKQSIWDDRGNWLGKIVKYKYLAVGVKDRPRHPVYLGLRHEDDL